MQDEQTLLTRARALDREALVEIHNSYYAPLFRYISFRVGDGDTAEELTSEVFIRLLDALTEKHAPHSTLRGWLYGVASRVVADHHRRQHRLPVMALHEALADHMADPRDALEEKVSRDELRQAVMALTEDQQHVIALRFGYEMPIREVADALGKSQGAIKQLQARAIAALGRKLFPGGRG